MSEIKSKIFEYGNVHEAEWPPKYGTGRSGRMQWCPVQNKVVPQGEVLVEVKERKHACAAHGYIPDEMPETKSPLTGKIYTSKAKLRAEYRQHNVCEVGNEYENGHDPEREKEREWKDFTKGVKAELRERINNG